MFKIANVQIKEASRVYGDMAEKVAFNISVNPSDVLGSIAGGYVANSVYNKSKDKHMQNELNNRRLENDTYSQVQNIMRDLKIVFTPINVIYSVNGQVFEIIQADEMTPAMKNAFLQKDADYFKNLLMNKMNMELQLAQRAFAQRLLTSGGYTGTNKEATFLAKQDHLLKLAQEEFDTLYKTASEGLDKFSLTIDPSLDNLRPFSKSDCFVNPNSLQKVANIFDVFHHPDVESQDIGLHRFNNEINVGFLPDRVVFLWNGQLVDQLTLLHMNDEGYEAFRRRDKSYFIDLFNKHTKELNKAIHTSSHEPEHPLEESQKEAETSLIDTEEKVAASLNDVTEDLVDNYYPVIERSYINPFADADVHIMAYDKIMSEKYGKHWADKELEALLKQLEVDYNLEHGIAEVPLNKISMLYTLSSDEHAVFQTSLTFEKFVRVCNSKTISYDVFEGNLSFEEIMFAIEIAKAFDGDEVFLQFHETVAPYVADELFRNSIRVINNNLYDSSNPSEKNFFDWVNDYLMRKWKEEDTYSMTNEDDIEKHNGFSEDIADFTNEVLDRYADEIDVENPYVTVEQVIKKENVTEGIPNDRQTGVINMIKENVVQNLIASLFVAYKHNELIYTLDKLKEEGVIRG